MTVEAGDWSFVSLVGADLGGLDLTGVRLIEADLSGADLTETVLRRADLSRAALPPPYCGAQTSVATTRRGRSDRFGLG